MILDLNTYRQPVRELTIDHADELHNLTLSRMIREQGAIGYPPPGSMSDDAFDVFDDFILDPIQPEYSDEFKHEWGLEP